jgi:predicted GNAT family N-acyltransferase
MTAQNTAVVANRPVVTIKLASTSDELLQSYMLRAAVYMGEQHCPYWEEYDGNDYSASHLVLYVDGEPAGCMRVRWFATFAKLERAVVLKR